MRATKTCLHFCKHMPTYQPRTGSSGSFSGMATPVRSTTHIVDSVRNRYLKYKHADQYAVHYEGGMIFKLKRKCSGHCDICKRCHTSDHAYLQLWTNGEIHLHCHRSARKVGVLLDKLGFSAVIELCAMACKQRPSVPLDGAITYIEKYIKHELLAPGLPSLKLGNGKLNAAREKLPSLMFCSATGTGKTMYIDALVKANPGRQIVCVTCKKSLANANGQRHDIPNYQDIRKPIITEDRIMIQAESLWRLDLDFYLDNDVILILDEVSSLFDQMTSKSTMGDKHDMNNVALNALIEGVARVVCFDADLTNEDVQLVKSLRDDVQVIHNMAKPQDGDNVMMYETKPQLQVEICDLMCKGNRIWISSTLSAKRSMAIHRDLASKGYRGMCITRNIPESEKRYVAENINSYRRRRLFHPHTNYQCRHRL
ncbi:hypothetical protein BC939DRAFT_470745 [Gamsiella multidivaricata]|uniref:uncharacterized protein n=1 Tax=Gamsiella multidivaricata TaxID=101098 RepID=UPI0022200003|nr:uncharacterized protein BC939DRAFT_470745 [Gamsiella multidivaricata]KAI7815988.1 hypothetical protein BC939DRAFT_470745 [Gamsiella multidivaricata]